MSLRLTAAIAAALASVAVFAAAPSAHAAAAPLAAPAPFEPPAAAPVTPESLVADLDAPAARPTAPPSALQRAASAAAGAWASFSSAASAPTTGWQCANFARLFSGIEIFGDAWTWWSQAVGKYARGFTPKAGSVLVFKPNGAMRLGHVAVVSQVLTDRIIQVTHANWSLIGGRRGQVEKDVTVVDVSPSGDWSQVKVWYDPTNNLGTTVYPTYGFVYRALDAVTRAASGQALAAR